MNKIGVCLHFLRNSIKSLYLLRNSIKSFEFLYFVNLQILYISVFYLVSFDLFLILFNDIFYDFFLGFSLLSICVFIYGFEMQIKCLIKCLCKLSMSCLGSNFTLLCSKGSGSGSYIFVAFIKVVVLPEALA